MARSRDAWHSAKEFHRRRSAFSSRPMSSTQAFIPISNGSALPWAELPELGRDDFIGATGAELARGGRLCSVFGVPENSDSRLVAVVAFDSENTITVGRSKPFTGSFRSLTNEYPQAHLFEREVWEQRG